MGYVIEHICFTHGLAERAVETFKEGMKKMQGSGKSIQTKSVHILV